MFDESEVSSGKAFGLIETMACTREAGIVFLAQHLTRLAHSCAYFGFVYEAPLIVKTIEQAAHHAGAAGALRLRLVLQKNGDIEVTQQELALDVDALWRVVSWPEAVPSSDVMLRHKTTLRDRYEQPLAQAKAQHPVDEILFHNERGVLCEGARSSLFLELENGFLVTPSLDCGVLPGVLRTVLLQSGRAREGEVRLSDVRRRPFLMGNAVRGLVRCQLID